MMKLCCANYFINEVLFESFIEHILVLPLWWPVTACSANSATDSDDSLHPFSVSYQMQQDFPVLTGMVL